MGKASNKVQKSKKQAEDDVDYAAAADSFADADDDGLLEHADRHDDTENDNRRGLVGDAEEEEDDDDAGSEGGISSDEGEDGSDGDSVSEGGGGSGGSEDGSGSSDESDGDDLGGEGDDDDGIEDEQGQPIDPSQVVRPVSSSHAEPCTFDLRNLLAMNTHQVDTVALYKPPSMKQKVLSDVGKTITIPGDSMPAVANDDVLLRMATDGCQQLIAALWQLPVERSDAGPLVTLPGYEEVRIPRALPPPPPKQDTKWEKFAKERGIALNKNKRSQKVWDEATNTWMFRHGYNKANDANKEWPIMEIKEGQNPFEDPWQAQREAKKAKVDKNVENRLKNQERAGALPKGTASKVLKGRAKVRQAGSEGGDRDRDVLPAGLPVDLQRTKVSEDAAPKPALRGKKSTVDALLAVQRSTASLGKFDKMREGEPERKKSLAAVKKRKYESATDKKVLSTEAERGMKVLKAVVDGGGMAKERAIKKGKLAKGETAYDYDYNDGLGASSFRKKKGRAGAGKMKKMTKKRVR